MSARKTVVTTIDSILEIMKDYTMGQVPEDAKAIKLMYNPHEKKCAIVAESAEWTEGMLPIGIKFHLTRLYTV
jgi:hypothetical protein